MWFRFAPIVFAERVRTNMRTFVCFCVCVFAPVISTTAVDTPPFVPNRRNSHSPDGNISPPRPRSLSFWWYARARAWDMIFAHISTAILHDSACSTTIIYTYIRTYIYMFYLVLYSYITLYPLYLSGLYLHINTYKIYKYIMSLIPYTNIYICMCIIRFL